MSAVRNETISALGEVFGPRAYPDGMETNTSERATLPSLPGREEQVKWRSAGSLNLNFEKGDN